MRRLNPSFSSVPLAALLLLNACEKGDTPLGPPVDADFPTPLAAISDAAHSSNVEHFYFLPPMVSHPNVDGTFDGTLSPEVTICQLDGGECAATQPAGFPILFTMTTGPGSETIRVVLTDEHYIANWHTDQFALSDTESYRISVGVDGQVLGYADVDMVTSGRELKNVNTGEYIALMDGRTLPIKFRIEDGALDSFCADPDVVACWSFDEGAGQVASDATAFANHGRLGSAGGPDGNDPDWIAGRTGNAVHFEFDGSGPLTATRTEYIVVPNDPSLEPANGITVETWFRASASPGNFSYLVGKGGEFCSFTSYALYTDGTGGLFFYVMRSTSKGPRLTLSADAGPGVWDGTWHHVAGTYDGQVVRLYLDGAEVGTGTPGSGAIFYGTTTYSDLIIGSYEYQQGCRGGFRGDLDDLAIWKRALTSPEVMERANR